MKNAAVAAKARELFRGTGLAPMVRASTTPLRILALDYGADFVYTEEFVDRMLQTCEKVENEELQTVDFVKPKQHVGKKRKRDPAPLILRIDPAVENGKLIGQIGTADPQNAVAAVKVICEYCVAININMGCPKKFSISGGMGSALLSDPPRAFRIVRAVSEEMALLGKPVSAKIRLLKDVAETVQFIEGLIEAGAYAVEIHGRRVGDESTQPADRETLKSVIQEVKKLHPDVPLLANGDFYTRDDFMQFQRETGADGVLLARAALYNTSIFRKPQGSNDNCTYGYDSILLDDRSVMLQKYLKLAVKYQAHYKNVKYCVCEFLSSKRAPSDQARFLKQSWPDGQTCPAVAACQSLAEVCKLWNVDCDADGASTQQQGEHKYSDEYLLKLSDENQSKRSRVEQEKS